LRCDQTGFQVDHFRAHCRFTTVAAPEPTPLIGSPLPTEVALLDLIPRQDLYGGLLFHGPRFQRLTGYRQLTATRCTAVIGTAPDAPWFGRYLPGELRLGDPAVRDTAIHAIQACIPHARLLPVAVERIVCDDLTAAGPWTVTAQERWRQGDEFCYDLTVQAANGRQREHWQGLRLRKLVAAALPAQWPPVLLAPYLERRLVELLPGAAPRLALATGGSRDERRDRALRQLLGPGSVLFHRPDGKPELLDGAQGVSVAHSESLTVVVIGAAPLACDVEAVQPRPPQVWQDLLGSGWDLVSPIVQATGEDEQTAATRVWCARECLKKAGTSPHTPLLLVETGGDGWNVLSAGETMIASYLAPWRESATPIVLAVLGERSVQVRATGPSLLNPPSQPAVAHGV
jgi:enediyne polyketide synthase